MRKFAARAAQEAVKRTLHDDDFEISPQSLLPQQLQHFQQKVTPRQYAPVQQRSTTIPDKPWLTMFANTLITKNHHTIPIPLLGNSTQQNNNPMILPKVAAFDFDGTICHTKSGNIIPENEDDWKWFDPSVLQKIRDTYNEGFDIVVFSNQLNCIKENRSHALLIKFDNIINIIGVPISFYISTDKNMFRKPSRGMFDFMLDRYHSLLTEQYPGIVFAEVIDPERSFYVGDAAGRDVVYNKNKINAHKKDFSSADFDFAVNIFGISNIHKHFFVPETFFNLSKQFVCSSLSDITLHFKSYKSTCPYKILSTIPSKHFDITTTPIYQYLNTNQNFNKPQILILSSQCASGKTTFCQELIYQFSTQSNVSYSWVNQDTLKTSERCYKACQTFLKQGHVVLIDNTNYQPAIREKYIDLAKSFKVPVHCVYIQNDYKDIPFHLNSMRVCYSMGARERLPSMAIHVAFNNYEPPTAKEGYNTLSIIPFQLVRQIPFFSASKPCPPPPLGPSSPRLSPLVPSKTLNEATTANDRHPEHIQHFGAVTKSRSLEDYFYQRYAK